MCRQAFWNRSSSVLNRLKVFPNHNGSQICVGLQAAWRACETDCCPSWAPSPIPASVSDSADLGWGQRVHVSNKFLGDADVAGPATTLGDPSLQ